jgi:hypothetical protein
MSKRAKLLLFFVFIIEVFAIWSELILMFNYPQVIFESLIAMVITGVMILITCYRFPR